MFLFSKSLDIFLLIVGSFDSEEINRINLFHSVSSSNETSESD